MTQSYWFRHFRQYRVVLSTGICSSWSCGVLVWTKSSCLSHCHLSVSTGCALILAVTCLIQTIERPSKEQDYTCRFSAVQPSPQFPRRSRLGHSWTLPWAVTSPRDTGPLSPRLRADNGIKRERLGTSLSAVYFFGGKCPPKTTCKGVGAGWWVCFQRRCCYLYVSILVHTWKLSKINK